MLSTLPHPRKLSLFLVLSAADLCLTWYLLSNSGGTVGEANPLADWLLSRGGWAGLAVFKTVTVLLVVGASLGIERRRPAAGGFVLGLACGVLSLVVGWSVALSVSVATRSDGLLDSELSRLLLEEDKIDHRLDMGAEYRTILFRLVGEVGAGECRLPDAVAELARTQRAADPRWQATLQETFPMPTMHQSLAAHLSHHVVAEVSPKHPDRVAGLVRRLEAEFFEAYPSPPVERTDRPFYLPKPPFPPGDENVADGERNPPPGPTIKEGTTFEPGRGRRRLPPRFFPGGRVPFRPGDGHAPDAANASRLPG
jgi:hypothetical protein